MGGSNLDFSRGGQGGKHVPALFSARLKIAHGWPCEVDTPAPSGPGVCSSSLVQIGRTPFTDEIDERRGEQGHVAGGLVSEEEPNQGEKSACYSGPSDVQDLPHARLNRQGSWST
jgi:hypothetical protein